MYTKKYLSAFALLLIIASAGVASHVSAQTNPSTMPASQGSGMMHKGAGMGRMGGMKPAAFGTVSAVNGTTLTITETNPKDSTTTTYTVDASNAKVMKFAAPVAGTTSTPGTRPTPATISVSDIAVGDTVSIQGTVSGTNVTATSIMDGVMMGHGGMMQKGTAGNMANFPQGNGQPIVGGTVSAISGNSITITNSSGTAYTIDATAAKIMTKGNATSTISSVAVGDSVLVQGAVNGQSVTASSVMDNGQAPATGTQGGAAAPQAHTGFFGAIGGFFKHLFGF